MPMFVVNTNTVIDYFKGRGKVAERLLTVPSREIALTATVAYEVTRAGNRQLARVRTGTSPAPRARARA